MSFNIFAKILVLALIVCLAYSQKQFTGSAIITNDPAMNPGSSVTVDPFYYDDTNQLWRLDYPNLRDPNTKAQGFKEIYDFQKQVYYQLCSVCQTYSNPLPTPKFYKETTDIRASSRFTFSLNGQACDPWQKINPQDAGIAYVWVTASGLTCRAERTDGLTYNFNITKTVVGAPAASVFTLPTTNKCPNRPLCSAPIDLVLVLDQSGSIHRDEWADLTKFATGVVNSFVVGPNNTHIGLVYFSGTQYATGENPASCCGLSDPALPLNFDNDTIIKFLLNHEQTGGHTCINCGIKTATTYEPNRNRPIQVPKIMLVLTDGFNNRMTNFFDIDIQNAKNEGWNMFAIGVRNASMEQLNQIASKPNQVYFIDNFDALETISKSVVYSLCGAFPTLTPCGPGCKGKCACGGKCVCPQCNNPDLCTESVCVENIAGSGCLFTPTFCDPLANNGDLCKINRCDKTTGKCTLINKNCSALLPDSCYTQVCDPKIGCTVRDSCPPVQNIPGTQTQSLCFERVCSNGVCGSSVKACGSANACAVQSCDDKLGCISTPINCDDGNACTLDTCDRNLGCQNTKIQCPSKEFLNSPAGKNNLCLTFTCDPKIGCTSTPKTCDDNNVCTTDSCNPATGQCVNTPITCTTPTDKCMVAFCDAKAGCVLAAKNCNDNKFCTTDSCNPATGQCVNTPITCAPNATLGACADQVCEESARACVSKPKITCPQPTNKCQTAVCLNGACSTSNIPVSCPVSDLCTVGVCDPNNGCLSQPKICDDFNRCTTDTCDAATGNCVFTPIPNCNNTNCTNCVSTSPCIIKKCVNGTCVTSPFSCPPNLCGTVNPTVVGNECRCITANTVTCPNTPSACGEQVCNPNTGKCEFTNTRICNDNNPCTTDVCVVVNGRATCNFTQITCPGDSPCSRKKCVVQNGQPTCVANDLINSLNCTANACSTAKCNPTTGKCEFTAKPCPNVSNTTCARNICNPVTGICEASTGLNCPANDPAGCGTGGVCIFNDATNTQTCKYNPSCPTDKNDGCLTVVCKPQNNGQPGICQENKFSCDDNNPCTNEVCQPDGVDVNGVPKTKCVSTPVVCPPSTDPCSLNLCTNVNGVARCVLTPVVCNTTTSKCLTGKCFVENGRGVCRYNETNCGVPDRCTSYHCDPVQGCRKISKCDDKNPCTNDLCDPKTGVCSYSQKTCNSTSPCKKGLCDPNIGCVERPIDCAKDRNITALDACHFVVCVNTTGCTVAVVPNSLDKCGTCNATACALRNKSKVPAGAIAGAVIGGAIIAGIVALGIGLFAASQGAAAFTPGTQVQMMGGSNNPLYTDGDTGGTNPFDDNDYVPL